jgi:hypothetical protein
LAGWDRKREALDDLVAVCRSRDVAGMERRTQPSQSAVFIEKKSVRRRFLAPWKHEERPSGNGDGIRIRKRN